MFVLCDRCSMMFLNCMFVLLVCGVVSRCNCIRLLFVLWLVRFSENGLFGLSCLVFSVRFCSRMLLLCIRLVWLIRMLVLMWGICGGWVVLVVGRLVS